MRLPAIQPAADAVHLRPDEGAGTNPAKKQLDPVSTRRSSPRSSNKCSFKNKNKIESRCLCFSLFFSHVLFFPSSFVLFLFLSQWFPFFSFVLFFFVSLCLSLSLSLFTLFLSSALPISLSRSLALSPLLSYSLTLLLSLSLSVSRHPLSVKSELPYTHEERKRRKKKEH